MKRENRLMLGSLDMRIDVVFVIADLRIQLKTMYRSMRSMQDIPSSSSSCGYMRTRLYIRT